MHSNDHAQMNSFHSREEFVFNDHWSFLQSNKNTWYVTAQLSKAKFYALQFLDTMTSVGYEVEEH